MAGRLVERGLLGVLALSEVSEGGDEKASCKVRIPLLPSDRDIGFFRVKDGEDEGGAGTGLLLGVGGLQCRPRVDEGEAEVWDGVDTGEGDDLGGALQIVDILSTSWELNSSYLQVVDTGNLLLGEGEGADIDEVNLQIVDPRSLLLGVGNLQIGFLGSQSLQIVAAGRYMPGLWIKDTWKLSSRWIKASVSNPLAEAFSRK